MKRLFLLSLPIFLTACHAEKGPREAPVWARIIRDGELWRRAVWNSMGRRYARVVLYQVKQGGKTMGWTNESLADARVAPQTVFAKYGAGKVQNYLGVEYHVYGPLELGVASGEKHFSWIRAEGWLYERGFARSAQRAAVEGPAWSGSANQASEAYVRGKYHEEKGDLNKAIAAYSEAIRLDPKDEWAWNDRGVAYATTDDFDKATADFNEAVRLAPRFADAYKNRGIVCLKVRLDEEAIADFTRAIQLDPEFAYAYEMRGYAYKMKGDVDKAIADLTQAIRLDPKDASAYKKRALVYKDMGELARAIADCTQVIQLEPQDPEFYLVRASLYKHMGETKKAEEDSSKGRKLDGNAAQ